ncbi:MAG: hypothetical protein ABIQ95_05180 [Bdellovibrionia bacterium]
MNDLRQTFLVELFAFISVALIFSCPRFTFADQESVAYTPGKLHCGRYILSGELRTQSNGITKLEIYPEMTSRFEIAINHVPMDIWLKFDESIISMEVDIIRNKKDDYPRANFIQIYGTPSNSPQLIQEKPCG